MEQFSLQRQRIGSETPTYILSAPCCGDDCDHQDKSSSGCNFQVRWAINPHMKVDSVQPRRAVIQHRAFQNTLRQIGAEVVELPFVHGAYDSVFTKDNGILKKDHNGNLVALLASPKHRMRQMELQWRKNALEELGFTVCGVFKTCFEGGDLVISPDYRKAYLGYGFRSEKAAAIEVSNFLGIEVTTLELKDPYFYHLDTALALTTVKTWRQNRLIAFAYPEAFTEKAWCKLQNDPNISELIPVSRSEALCFGLNWVEVNDTIVLGAEVPEISSQLERVGKLSVTTTLSQFQLAGGSAACLSTKIH